MNLERVKIIGICDKIILFSLYAIAFFLPISKALIESFSILAILIYLFKKIIQREHIPKAYLNLAIFVYLIICFFSIFISSNFKISTRTFLCKILQEIAFFFVVTDALNNKQRIRNFLYILFASSALLGIDGIYQYFTHKDFIRNRPPTFVTKIYASFHTPNDFACYLITVIPFLIVSFFTKFRFKISRFLLTGLFILLLTCLILTFSRGAWFGSIAAVLLLTLWLPAVGIFFLLLILFIIAAYPFSPTFIKGHLNNFFAFLNADILRDVGTIERKIIWQAGWKMFMSKPWIGVGLGTFMFNFKRFAIETYPYGPFYAHNCYLQMAAEIGVIGLLSFLSILIIFFYNGIKIINVHQRTFSWYVLLASLAATLGYCVQMGVDTNLYSLDLGMLFWLILGLGVAAMKQAELETK